MVSLTISDTEIASHQVQLYTYSPVTLTKTVDKVDTPEDTGIKKVQIRVSMSLLSSVLVDKKKKKTAKRLCARRYLFTCKHSEVESSYVAAVSQRTSVTQLCAFPHLEAAEVDDH